MDCCNTNGLMPVQEAKEIIKQTITPVRQTEYCQLDACLDRVLSEDVISPINVPAYDNSAMDGYAFRYADLASSNRFSMIGKSFAGNAFVGILKQGECVRIMAGAQIPQGADTVIMQEATQLQDGLISIQEKIEQGANIRRAGGDIHQGACVVSKGHRITPVDIGLLASLGLGSAKVYRKLKVAVFSTGDELLVPGEAAKSDRIFDSNRPMIIAMLNRLGIDSIDMGIIADNKDNIKTAFAEADRQADCVITSGGVSVGEADYTREVLEEYGQIDFWKLAIKPGKPLAFGRLPNSFFFGLPGNPVSAAVTFDQIANDALAHMSGCIVETPKYLSAIATSTFKKRPGRTDFQRVDYYSDQNGQLCVKQLGSQSSGVLSCFSRSNAYAVLESARGKVEVGDTVSVLPFSRLIK